MAQVFKPHPVIFSDFDGTITERDVIVMIMEKFAPQEWTFIKDQYELVTFSLMLEHIEDLNAVFQKVAKVTKSNGFVYVGELHPFKQYSGTKARFDTEEGQQIVTCFNHNISDFTQAAKTNGFEIIDVQEYFDDNDRTSIPRILTLLLRKK